MLLPSQLDSEAAPKPGRMAIAGGALLGVGKVTFPYEHVR